jgi:hypothetical protein
MVEYFSKDMAASPASPFGHARCDRHLEVVMPERRAPLGMFPDLSKVAALFPGPALEALIARLEVRR